jgi:hypothetical protein
MRIDTVREYARRACGDERNVFGPSVFSEHLVVVAACGSKLAAPLGADQEAVEAVCLSNADAAARILRPAYWLYFAFAVRKQSFEEGRRWLRSLLMRQWNLLIEPARELAGNEYRLALELLR